MARKTNAVPKFRRKQKVIATQELPGVPVGTLGKVYYEAGLRWFRYHVAFENGVELANVDGNALVTADEWEESRRADRRALRAAEREKALAEQVVVTGPAKH